VRISRDYPLKTRTSKQPIGKILGYEIIPSHPLKYLRSKQGLKAEYSSSGNLWCALQRNLKKLRFAFANYDLDAPKYTCHNHVFQEQEAARTISIK
jgi:hypothetical protein